MACAMFALVWASAGTAQVETVYSPPGNAAPVSINPPPSDDSPEEIAKDAARDLKDSRFYNRPGATREQFNTDWQECRLIARGTRTPSGTYTYVYNPAYISPVAASVGAGIGAAIGQAIVEGQLRRTNRRTCLMIRGWRLVEPPTAEIQRLGALGDSDRDAYLSKIIGANEVEGKVTSVTRFNVDLAPSVKLNTSVATPGLLWTGKKVDPALPITLKPEEALIAVAFRRTVPEAVGRSAVIQFSRYDADKRDLIYQPRDWKKKGDTTVYSVTMASKDRKAEYELQIHRVTAGNYVVLGTGMLGAVVANSYCFGAPSFHVDAGQMVYVGDMVPLVNAQMAGGGKTTTLAYTTNLEDARRTLAAKQPELAKTMTAATLRNRATYGCAAVAMDRLDWPGLDELPKPAAVDPAAVEPAKVTP